MKLSPVARELVSLIRRHRLTYDGLRKSSSDARKYLSLKPTKSGRTLPKLLSTSSLERYFAAIDKTDNLLHSVMLRLLLYTAVRVSELCSIRMSDVDLDQYKIFIDDGKGSKDRYILFPDRFRLTLKAYMQSVPRNKFLFESRQKKKFSQRRIQQIVTHYADVSGIEERVHPHLLRHQMLTWLTRSGLSDAQIQLVSGHASKASLEVYQHIGLRDVAEDYQAATRKMGI